MEIQVDVTKQDIIDFNWHFYSHSPMHTRHRKIVVIAGLLISLQGLLMNRPLTLANAPYIASGLGFSLLYLPYYRWVFTKRLKKLIAQAESKGMIGVQKMTLSPQGITNIGPIEHKVYEWKTVKQIVTADDCSYIFVGKLGAFIVPRRIFPDESAYTDFFNKVREYKAQATG